MLRTKHAVRLSAGRGRGHERNIGNDDTLLLLLLSVHLYSALSLQIPNALHALCQYLANRKTLSYTPSGGDNAVSDSAHASSVALVAACTCMPSEF